MHVTRDINMKKKTIHNFYRNRTLTKQFSPTRFRKNVIDKVNAIANLIKRPINNISVAKVYISINCNLISNRSLDIKNKKTDLLTAQIRQTVLSRAQS